MISIQTNQLRNSKNTELYGLNTELYGLNTELYGVHRSVFLAGLLCRLYRHVSRHVQKQFI